MELSGARMSRLEFSTAATNGESIPDTPIFMLARTQDLALVAALRCGDEAAFLSLIEQFYDMMIRMARTYVSTYEVAEEVVQETWIGVLRGLDRFEHRSSLKTWVFRILINRAKSYAQREARCIAFSDVLACPMNDNESAVGPEYFEADGWWKSHPNQWNNQVEEHVLNQEVYTYIQQALQALPPDQSTVLTLRDIEGWAATEVCEVLSLSEENQRVLLHRARAKVRNTLENYVGRRKNAKGTS